MATGTSARLSRLALGIAISVATLALPGRAPAVDGDEDAPRPRRVAATVHRRDLLTGETVTLRAPRTSSRARLPARAPAKRVADLVIGSDDRQHVSNTTSYPFSAVCKVRMRFPDGKDYTGSAVMVGPRHAVTAGHVVHELDSGGWATQVRVQPGFDGSTAPWGTFTAVNLYSVSGWTGDQSPEWDFGVIELGTRVGETTGWLGAAVESTNVLLGSILNTAGYPADLQGGEHMYFASGAPSGVSTFQIHYADTMDTAGGQSGSGLWTWDGIDRTVVGVHTLGGTTENSGTRLTQDLYDLLAELVIEPEPGTETLALFAGRCRVRDRAIPGGDDMRIKGEFFFDYDVSDGIVNPSLESTRLRLLSGEAGDPVLDLQIPAGHGGWTSKRSGLHTWKGTLDDGTWNVLKIHTRRRTLSLQRKLDDLPEPPPGNPWTLELTIGDDFGRKPYTWYEKKPGLWVW